MQKGVSKQRWKEFLHYAQFQKQWYFMLKRFAILKYLIELGHLAPNKKSFQLFPGQFWPLYRLLVQSFHAQTVSPSMQELSQTHTSSQTDLSSDPQAKGSMSFIQSVIRYSTQDITTNSLCFKTRERRASILILLYPQCLAAFKQLMQTWQQKPTSSCYSHISNHPLTENKM